MPIDENNKALVKNRTDRKEIDFRKYLTRSVSSMDGSLDSIKGDMSSLKDTLTTQTSREFEYQKAQERVDRRQEDKFEGYFEESSHTSKRLLGTFGDFIKRQGSMLTSGMKDLVSDWMGPELNKGAMLTARAIGKGREASESLLTFFRKQKKEEKTDPALERGADAIEEASSGILSSFRFRIVQGFTKHLAKWGSLGESISWALFGVEKASKKTKTNQEILLQEMVDGLTSLNENVIGGIQKEEDRLKAEEKWRMEDRKRELSEPEETKPKSWLTRLILFLAGGFSFFVGLLVGYFKPLLKTLKLSLLKPIQSMLAPFKLLRSTILGVVGIKMKTKITDFISKVKGFFIGIIKSIGKSRPVVIVSGFLKSIKTFFTNLIKPLTNIAKAFGKWTGLTAVFKYIGELFPQIIKTAKESGLFKLGKFIGKAFYVFAVILSVFDFLRGFTQTEGDFLTKLKAGLYEAFEGIFQFPVKIIGKAVDWVLGLFDISIEGGAGAAMWEGLAKTFKFTMNLFFGYWKMMWDVLTIVARLVKETLSLLWDKIQPYGGPILKSIISLLKDYVGPFFTWTIDKISSIFSSIYDAISWLAKPLKKGETMWSRVAKGLERIGDKLIEKLSGFGDMVSSVLNWVTDKLSWITDKFDAVKKIFGSGRSEEEKKIEDRIARETGALMSSSLVPGYDNTKEKDFINSLKKTAQGTLKAHADSIKTQNEIAVELKKATQDAKLVRPETKVEPIIPIKPNVVGELDYSQHELWRLKEKQKDYMMDTQKRMMDENRRIMEKGVSETKEVSKSIVVLNQTMSSHQQAVQPDHTPLMSGAVTDLAFMTFFY